MPRATLWAAVSTYPVSSVRAEAPSVVEATRADRSAIWPFRLTVCTVQLTDAGVRAVAALGNLTELDLYHTLVTDKGFEQLKAALPKCRIHYERDSARRERRS